LQFVYRKIVENRLISIQMRQEIHQYAMDNFSWGKIIEKYIETCL